MAQTEDIFVNGLTSIQPSSGVNVGNANTPSPIVSINDYNLFLNPSFENDVVEYSAITGSANFSINSADNLLGPNNKRCLKIESDTGGEFRFVVSGNPINTGVKGVYEFWMLNDQEVVILISTTGGGSAVDLIPISNVWKKHSYNFNLGSGATDISFAVASDSNTFLDMMYVGAMEALDKDLLIQVTASEAQALIGSSKLIEGSTYEITGADPSADVFETGFTVWLTALSPNELSLDGQVRMYTPKYADRPIWADGNVYAAGDKASWGGKVWDNLNGNVGTATDTFNLDSEWQVINIGDSGWGTYYNVQLYPVGYDVLNDEILLITTLRGSNVYSNGKALGFGNPIKYYQWGNDYDINSFNGISGDINNAFFSCVNNSGNIGIFSMKAFAVIADAMMDSSSVIEILDMDEGGSINFLTFENVGMSKLAIKVGSGIDSISAINSGIALFNIEASSIDDINIVDSSIDSFTSINSTITSFVMANSARINETTINESEIIGLDIREATILSLNITNCRIGIIEASLPYEYKAKIVMYGITGNPDINFGDYPKLLEPCTATFLQKSTGEIVVFYESADGGMSASEFIEPVNDEDYVQAKLLPKYYVLSTNQSVTSTSETPITETLFPVEADSYYEVELFHRIGCSGASGVSFGILQPSDSNVVIGQIGRRINDTSISVRGASYTGDTGIINAAFSTDGTANGAIWESMNFKTGATAGNVQMSFASRNASQTSIIYELSYIKVTKYTPQ